MLQVATFPSGADTVVAVWVRLWAARRERIPLVNADPDLAEKEALRNSSIVQQNELDVQARYGISVAKSNGGAVPAPGAGGRWFNSSRPDHRSALI